MALTINSQKRYTIGARWETITNITLDTKYPTGGYALTGTTLGLPLGLVDVVSPQAPSGFGYAPVYNTETEKLQMFDPTSNHTHTENTNATYVQNATTSAATAAPAVEVPNETSLSTVILNVICRGR